MKIAFRADASLQIGSGHVMRCLTLADALKQKGAECHFLCREHPGHLLELVRGKGHVVHVLPCEPESPIDRDGSAHAAWLGATQEQDAQACLPILQALQPDWLIVDHYALDISWEERLRPFCQRLMVIDDLADRPHGCDLLLDQNLGRQASDYAGLIPVQCTVLAGPQYALLRPEFAVLREYSLKRREQSRFQNLLITMGGVDEPNATGRVLEALKQCPLPDDLQINVVLGPKAPWLEQVQAIAVDMPWPTKVRVNVTDMAKCMADCDLAIGAAGSTSWERCCMGVPALMVVLAENQAAIGNALQLNGAAILIGAHADSGFEERCSTVLLELIRADGLLRAMSKAAADVTNGAGSEKVARWLLNE